MSELWTSEHESLLVDLTAEILKGPLLARPNHERRFYLKSNWSKDKMGAVLLQPDDTPAAVKAEERESTGGKCEFDRNKSGLRLQPIAFISRMSTPAELSYHSYVGEAATGRWAIGKFRLEQLPNQNRNLPLLWQQLHSYCRRFTWQQSRPTMRSPPTG